MTSDIPPYRRVPLGVKIGDGALQSVGYVDRRCVDGDEEVFVRAVAAALRAAADNLESA